MNAGNNPNKPRGYLSIGQVVAAIQKAYPDVSQSSLRFLEREGLLTAMRSAGGHRLYSPRDVERVRMIKRWQEQRLSLRDIRERLTMLDRLATPSVLTAACLRHLMDGDLEPARQALLSAADAGLSLEVIFGDVIQEVLIDVGNRWQMGDLLVAQEKEISEMMREVIVELTLRSAGTSAGPRVVAACVEGERHELGLRMICGLLRARDYDTRFLGADVAAPFLCEAVQLHRPVAVLLSASMPRHIGAVEAAIKALGMLRDEIPTPTIIVGGHGVADNGPRLEMLGAFPLEELHAQAAAAAVMGLLPVSDQP